MRLVLVVLVVAACKAKGSAPASSSSGSAPVVTLDAAAAIDAAATPPAKAALEFDDKSENLELSIAFERRVPKLPAVSADGTRIADYRSDADMPGMSPAPTVVTIRPLTGKGLEELQIVDSKLANSVIDTGVGWDVTPPKPEIVKLLHERGTAIVKRLDGFATLDEVELEIDSSGEPQPTMIGDAKITAVTKPDERLHLALVDAKGKPILREVIEPYTDGVKPADMMGSTCNYRPFLSEVFRDRARPRLYVAVRFKFHESCTMQEPRYIVWELPSPATAELAKLVTDQFDARDADPKLFTADAQFINSTDLADPVPYIIKAGGEQYMGHDDDNVLVAIARDGKSAWGSATTKLAILPQNEKGRDDPWRASSVLTKTADGWRIAASMWSTPYANDAANKAASSGKLVTPKPFTADKGDATLIAAFDELVRTGLDEDALVRGDLVAIGSAPGEYVIGGSVFAKGWNAAWKGKAKVASSIARTLPSGTTGWVSAVVELPKKSYKIPFVIFAVFDKNAAGAWSLVHLHFSI